MVIFPRIRVIPTGPNIVIRYGLKTAFLICILTNFLFACISYHLQKKIFEDIGKGILDNAWKGYNATLFAYGQTGSGKSWSVVGYGQNKGIVPMLANQLFAGIREGREGTTFEVKLSMLEIYNEVARDLLDAKSTGKKQGLKIRQHPKKGFYGKYLLKNKYF